MRHSLAVVAAALLILSSTGSAIGADPGLPASPAPISEPTPASEPTPSTDPGSSAVPDPANPAGPDAAGVDADPSPDPAALVGHPSGLPAEPAIAPVVAAAGGPASAKDDRVAQATTDPKNRWIVVLKAGTDADAAVVREGKRIGFKADRTYRHSLRGYAATLLPAQVTALSHDPSVALIVADEPIHAESQVMPTGISRIGANRSSAAAIDGVDNRVDADVAIVDTGIAKVADLNVAGGYNCSTADSAAWRDLYGHGTHVAGTVGAIDDGNGVVGVAPGVRLWAVKILNDAGDGLLSWYVCGLDWIAAQRDPNDPTRPLFEAVNMSVTKWGRDDSHCGAVNKDILHAAICRLVASGVTVVAAAANDSGSAAARVPAAYNEVITVSALADTDGKPGGLGGHRCYSWGSYDLDDTFADFSNYGSDVDLIAPGKCIWSTVPSGYAYLSGTSMAAPHVTGAVALLKASRPGLTPAEVREALLALGNLNWKTSTDPDPYHEPLLDVSRIGPRGDFSVAMGADVTISEAGGPARFPITITRTATSFERIRLAVDGLPAGATAFFAPSSLFGFSAVASTLTVTMPFRSMPGTYSFTISADEHGNVHATASTIVVQADIPVVRPPTAAALVKALLGTTSLPTSVSWAAATDQSGIATYEVQASVDAGAWQPATTMNGTVRSFVGSQTIGHRYQYRIRARDGVGIWSDWLDGPSCTGVLVQDRTSAVAYTGTWRRVLYSFASGGSTTYATAAGARARTTFSGRGVAIVAPVGTSRGSAKVYIDHVYRGTVNFRSTTNRSRIVMYTTTFPTLGTHTAELIVSGTGRVDLDTFVILR